jgi:hypothetical protein
VRKKEYPGRVRATTRAAGVHRTFAPDYLGGPDESSFSSIVFSPDLISAVSPEVFGSL